MTKRIIIRVIAFVLVLSSLLFVMCDLFEHSIDRTSKAYQTFYDLEEDTVDVLFLGTSGLDRYYVTPKAFEDYGITSFHITADGFPCWLMETMLKSSLKKQDAELVIIDMRSFSTGYTDSSDRYDVRSRRVIDSLDFFSTTRLEAIDKSYKAISKYTDEGGLEYYLSFFLSFIKYHTQWQDEEELSFEQLGNPESDTMGYWLSKSLSLKTVNDFPETVPTDEKKDLDEICEESLYEFLDYLDENVDCEVLFINTPHYLSENEYKRMNTLCEILDSRGYKYLWMPMDYELYDVTTDYYNDGHVNYYGALKFTDSFSEYLLQNYELPDRRQDEKCQEDWYGPYDVIKKRIAKWEEAK